MKFGRNIWYGDRPLGKAFEKAWKLDFDYIELSLDFPWPDGFSEKEIKLLEGMKEEFNLELAFHGPWAGYFLAHPSDEISDASLKVYEKCLKFAKKFNTLYFNFHPASEEATLKFKEIEEIALRRMISSAVKILEFAGDLLVTIENSPFAFFGIPSQFKQIFQKVKKINFCFDVGHATTTKWFQDKGVKEFQKEKMELKDWLTVFKNKILAAHLHDCLVEENKEPLDHIPIGHGNLNFEEIASLIKQTKCKYILIEILRLKKGVPVTEKALKESLEICRSLFL